MNGILGPKGDQFEDFLKRHSQDKPRTLPKDLFQVAVFYSRLVSEEINLENEEKAQEILKNTSFLKKSITKYSLRNITEFSEKLLDNQRFVFPFYSEDVFMSPAEAQEYIPRFVKKLIGQGKLPEEAIKENRINYDILETGIVPLNLVTLERLSEFKDIELKV